MLAERLQCRANSNGMELIGRSSQSRRRRGPHLRGLCVHAHRLSLHRSRLDCVQAFRRIPYSAEMQIPTQIQPPGGAFSRNTVTSPRKRDACRTLAASSRSDRPERTPVGYLAAVPEPAARVELVHSQPNATELVDAICRLRPTLWPLHCDDKRRRRARASRGHREQKAACERDDRTCREQRGSPMRHQLVMPFGVRLTAALTTCNPRSPARNS
jgi:hypothetical protein